MTEQKEIIAIVTLLAGVFRVEVTKPMLSGFCLALADLSETDLRKAVARALTECKFFPAPAELRAFAGRKRLEAPYHAPLPPMGDLRAWTQGQLQGDWRVPKRLAAIPASEGLDEKLAEAKGTG